jgi:hypothetical protein
VTARRAGSTTDIAQMARERLARPGMPGGTATSDSASADNGTGGVDKHIDLFSLLSGP